MSSVLLNVNQMQAPAFEPKRKNRFIVLFNDKADLVDADFDNDQFSNLHEKSLIAPWTVKRFNYNFGQVTLDRLGDINLVFHDPVIPSSKKSILLKVIPKLNDIRITVCELDPVGVVIGLFFFEELSLVKLKQDFNYSSDEVAEVELNLIFKKQYITEPINV